MDHEKMKMLFYWNSVRESWRRWRFLDSGFLERPIADVIADAVGGAALLARRLPAQHRRYLVEL